MNRAQIILAIVAIAVVSGFILGIAYYFLTLSTLPAHITYDIGVDPTYVVTSILLTLVVAILGGINIPFHSGLNYLLKEQVLLMVIKERIGVIIGWNFLIKLLSISLSY